LRACCIPLPARGSSLFRHPCPPIAETFGGGSQDAFPGDASHTLQSFPLASSRTASPTSCCLLPR
jgi:hypothetical protein